MRARTGQHMDVGGVGLLNRRTKFRKASVEMAFPDNGTLRHFAIRDAHACAGGCQNSGARRPLKHDTVENGAGVATHALSAQAIDDRSRPVGNVIVDPPYRGPARPLQFQHAPTFPGRVRLCTWVPMTLPPV